MKTWHTNLRGSEFRVSRLSESTNLFGPLSTPESAVNFLRPRLAESLMFRPEVENMIVIHLSVKLRPIGFEIVSTGILDTLLVHPREVFRSAILTNAY